MFELSKIKRFGETIKDPKIIPIPVIHLVEPEKRFYKSWDMRVIELLAI